MPRLFTAVEPKSVVSGPYVVLSPPPLSRTSTMTRCCSARARGARASRRKPASATGPSCSPRRRPSRLRAFAPTCGLALPARYSGFAASREDRRVVAVERVRELRDVPRGPDGGERDVELLPVRALEREGRRVAPSVIPRPSSTSAVSSEVRREAAKVRVVVARHERPRRARRPSRSASVDRDEATADERGVRARPRRRARPRSRRAGAGTGGAPGYAPDRQGRAPCARSAGRAAR